MGIQAYFGLLRRYWPLLLACCAIGLLISSFIALRVTAAYSATSQVFVSTQTAATPSDLSAANTFSQAAIQSYAKVATMPYVLNGVITRLGLDTTPEALASEISVDTGQGSVILAITATDSSPSRAAAIANAVAAQLSLAVVTLNPQTTNLNSQVKLTMVAAATAPVAPTGSGIAFQMFLGVLGGLVVGVGAIALREALDTRIRGIADVEALTKRPVLGALRFDPVVASHPIVVVDRPTGAEAEGFRSLRSAVQVLRQDAGVRSIVVTSAQEGEGKSTIVANLAAALAANGIRTAVVDADLRRPTLARCFGLDAAVGLTDVLGGTVSLDAVTQTWGTDGLLVVPAGGPATNANELLQTRRMAQVIDRLVSEYDLVIIDSPPVLPVSDAAELARRTSGAILVAAAGQVNKQQLQRSRTVLDQMNARLLGVIVTMLPAAALERSYNYVPAPESRHVRISAEVDPAL